MPHVEIKCYPGRDEATKQKLVDKICEDFYEFFGANDHSLSVSVIEVSPDEWMEKVAGPQIKAVEDKLYKKPGYEY